MKVTVTEGDLLDQPVEVIVNAWNRNPFPWWLLVPQGVSGAIKRCGGVAPFRELRRFGLLSLGDAVLTSAGHLPFRSIIHVAGIGWLWRASRVSIQTSVRNAIALSLYRSIALAARERFGSLAFPSIGPGTGGFHPEEVERLMLEELRDLPFEERFGSFDINRMIEHLAPLLYCAARPPKDLLNQTPAPRR